MEARLQKGIFQFEASSLVYRESFRTARVIERDPVSNNNNNNNDKLGNSSVGRDHLSWFRQAAQPSLEPPLPHL